MKLTKSKLTSLTIGKSICDGANLYYTRTGKAKGKWTFRYQRRGKKREMGLGPFPFISLSQARQRARECHTSIHQGKDPLVKRRDAESQRKIRQETKFSAIAEMYIEEHKFEWTNKKHASDWASTLKRFAYEKLDGKPLADLTTVDILGALKPLWQDKRETG